MAIVKVLFRKNADNVIRYVLGHTQPGDPVDSECVTPTQEGASAEFKMVRDQHKFNESYNKVVHVVQSWSEEDSKKLTPSVVNEMGRKLVEDYFKGHQFLIVTHTETGKLHNHIVINSVNYETGKLVRNKKEHWHKLKKVNDQICLERGLQVPNADANNRKARLPQNVQQMVRAGRQSWVYDIQNKADVARFLATSHDQYVDFLDAMGVKARVEEKNITYFYPGRSRGKRGDKLGKAYDKPSLEKQYQENDERFKAKPEIRNQLLAAHGKLVQEVSNAAPKDYSKFTKQSRRSPTSVPASERELTSQILPAEEFRKAKRSIVDYCLENNIGLTTDPHGRTILSGKSHIVIDGTMATNTRNGTKANLIDFVAAHHRLTLLQAVSKINGNANPLLIEQHFGVVDRKYTSFYIPKPDQLPFDKATEHLSNFLRAHRASPRAADFLLKHQRAEVSKDGVIRLFAESDPKGMLEFTEGANSAWHENKQGIFERAFFKKPSKGNRLFIFTDPKSYLSHRGNDAFIERGNRDGVLVLMEPNTSHVENYLAENPSVRKIHVISPKKPTLPGQSLDFFGVLKQRLSDRGFEFHQEGPEHSRSHESPGLDI